MPAPRLVLSLLLCAVTSPLRADEVVLKDGRRYGGVILRQTTSSVRILTPSGRTLTLRRRDVVRAEETLATGSDALDSQLAPLDGSDPEALRQAALRCRDADHAGWELIAYLGLKRHPHAAGLHELLGRVRLEGRWYSTAEGAWVSEGGIVADRKVTHPLFVRFKGGWIRKENRDRARREGELFVRDDRGFWRERAVVLREKGFVQVHGKWLKGIAAEDLEAMRRFEELTGRAIWIRTGDHVRIATQQGYEEARELSCFAEAAFAGLVAQTGLEAGTDPFGGRKLDVWILTDPSSFADWLEHYAAGYGLNEAQLIFFRRINKASTYLMAARELATDTATLRHWLANYLGHCFVSGLYAPDKVVPAWLGQAFGYLVQARHCGDIQVSFVDRGPRRDGSPGTFGVRSLGAAWELANRRLAAVDIPLEKLDAALVNELTQEHVVKGLTLVAWLLESDRDRLVRWIRRGGEIGLVAAVPEVFACDAATLGQRWREQVRARR